MSNSEIFGIFKKAAKLTKDPSNGCRVVSSQRHFALPPRYLGRLKKGTMEVLQAEIGKYSESLHAVPLAFSDLQIKQQSGNILDDTPHIHFDVTFKAVVFKPSIGATLKCVVNEFAGDHISCLVHNWFNLSLPLEGSEGQQNFKKGSKVTVRVTRITGKNGILAIQGVPSGQSIPVGQSPQDELQQSPFRKQKHDSGFFSETDDITAPSIDPILSAAGASEYYKAGTSTTDVSDAISSIVDTSSELMELGLDGEWEEITSSKKKKKKKKKRKIEDADMEELDRPIKKEKLDFDENDSGVMMSISSNKADNNINPEIGDETVDIQMKDEVVTPDLSDSARKRKKKRKNQDISSKIDTDVKICVPDVEIKQEPSYDESNVNEGSGKKKKKKKHSRDTGEGDASSLVSKTDIKIKNEMETFEATDIPNKERKKKKQKYNISNDALEMNETNVEVKKESACGETHLSENMAKRKKHKMKEEGGGKFQTETNEDEMNYEQVPDKVSINFTEITKKQKKKKYKQNKSETDSVFEISESNNIKQEVPNDKFDFSKSQSKKKKKKDKYSSNGDNIVLEIKDEILDEESRKDRDIEKAQKKKKKRKDDLDSVLSKEGQTVIKNERTEKDEPTEEQNNNSKQKKEKRKKGHASHNVEEVKPDYDSMDDFKSDSKKKNKTKDQSLSDKGEKKQNKKKKSDSSYVDSLDNFSAKFNSSLIADLNYVLKSKKAKKHKN